MNEILRGMYSFFIDPYKQGLCNIQDGWKGERISTLAAAAIGAQSPIPCQKKTLPLKERIDAVFVGLLLLVPVINILVLAILRTLGNRYLYKPDGIPYNAFPFDPLEPLVRTLTINQSRVADIPAPINLVEIIEKVDKVTDPIAIEELETLHFEQAFADEEEFSVIAYDERTGIKKSEARDLIRKKFIQPAEGRALSKEASMDRRDHYVLAQSKLIVFGLRNSRLTKEIRKEVFVQLVRAAQHCVLHQAGVLDKVFEILANDRSSLEQVALQFEQRIKEDLFREHYSLSKEPISTLNFIRRKVGVECGLDCHSLNLNAPYTNMHDARSPENPIIGHKTAAQFKEVFKQIYTPLNLVCNMKKRLNERLLIDPELQREFGTFIQDALKQYCQAGVILQEEAELLPPECPYTEYVDNGMLLTDRGVIFFLVHIGRLNSEIPHGHVVRSRTCIDESRQQRPSAA